MRRIVVLGILFGLGSLLSGCGPIVSTYLIVSAQADLDGAKAAEAEKYAVYEYTAATAYLHKAREEQGYADFGPSIDYAYKARDLAQKAVARSDEQKRQLSDVPPVLETGDASNGEQPKVIIQHPVGEARVVPIPAATGPTPR